MESMGKQSTRDIGCEERKRFMAFEEHESVVIRFFMPENAWGRFAWGMFFLSAMISVVGISGFAQDGLLFLLGAPAASYLVGAALGFHKAGKRE